METRLKPPATEDTTLTILDILDVLVHQPDCGTISMSYKDYYDLIAEARSRGVSWASWREKPETWEMYRDPWDFGTQIFGVPIAVI